MKNVTVRYFMLWLAFILYLLVRGVVISLLRKSILS